MQLTWMGEYRDTVEALIHYCNIYAQAYRPEKMSYRGVSYSYAQIQVLEYLLENEERHDNMSAIARRLGITRSNFTKIIRRLEQKGLVRKEPMPGSRRDLNVCVSQLGRELYEDYSAAILERHFRPMFESFDKVPPEYRRYMAEALFDALKQSAVRRRIEET